MVVLSLDSTLAYAQIPQKVLWKSLSAFAVRTARIEVARTQSELESMFSELGSPGGAPTIDFSRHTVVAYFMGWKPYTGYDVDVSGLSVRGGELLVDVVETSPAPHCGGLAVLTAPAVAVVTIPWRHEIVPVVTARSVSCGR